MDDNSDGLFQELEKNYCPPLDPALFTAIVSDFDLTDHAQVQQLRETLDTLKLSAWEQEDLPFDPSGTSGLSVAVNGVDALSEHSTSRNGTRETDITSLTSELSCMSVGGDNNDNTIARGSNLSKNQTQRSSIGYIIGADGSVSLSGATLEDKVVYLSEMFPSVDLFTVRHTLKKCDQDIDRSMDVLLNLAFFDELQPEVDDGVKVSIPKGVDGFEEESNGAVGPKKRQKKKKAKGRNGKSREQLQSLSSPLDEPHSATNKWDVGKADVDFIYSRTSPLLKREAVASAYHANGASLPATIRSLATANAPKEEHKIGDDTVLASQVAELVHEFSSVPLITLAGLLKITRGSISAANELATAMVKSPSPAPLSEMIKITSPPIALDVDEETPRRSAAGSRSLRNYDLAQSTAGSHFLASAEAFSKATTAYRRGKSDRLMGGAAAYYSAVGRDHLEKAKREVSAAADALVDSQSTPTMLDLHGVSVQDAVRIANNKVAEWWDAQGDAKYIRGGNNPTRQGYRIVTGAGRHSRDGTSRLGPAVGKMLAREGWRFEVDEGVLTVVGVVRRR